MESEKSGFSLKYVDKLANVDLDCQMMSELTTRQTQLLKAVIEEFIKTAKPVGSENLVGKYNLQVSPATVRNEMVRLIESGHLKQPHTSAGRAPTTLGLRTYLNKLMEEVSVPVLQEVAIKQRLWQERFEFEKFLRKATTALAEVTGYLSVVATRDGNIFSSGAANILEHPEFYDIDVTRSVLNLTDQPELLFEIFSRASGEGQVHVLIGEELGNSRFGEVSMIFSPFETNKRSGFLSVVGPCRMEYAKVIPIVKYFKSLISEMSQGW